jgi:predicted lipoprotein with Yx(FWY)xxD motif
MRKPLLALAIPALAVLAAGCGSSHAAKHVRKPPAKKVAVVKTKTTKAKTKAVTSKTTTTAAKKTPTKVVALVKVESRTLPHLGPVLVDSAGRTLYVFALDHAKRVTCNASCQAVWPPLKLAANAKPVAVGPVKAKLLGSDPNPVGGRVVTYNGWPLYTYAGDSAPGVANGEGLQLNGGRWYVISPAGAVIRGATKTPASAKKTATKSKSKSSSSTGY